MYHIPVLLHEVLKYLDPLPGRIFIDCTMGGGGHAKALLDATAPDGKVLAIDLDDDSIKHAISNFQFAISNKRLILVQDNFKNIKNIAKDSGFEGVDGILYDLGVSSHQLDDKTRGFGFENDTLDMRMDAGNGITAAEIINTWQIRELQKIFKELGEERLHGIIAKTIALERKKKPIVSAKELSDIISSVYERHYRKPSMKNPATKVFQALRMSVNDELHNLELSLGDAMGLLKPGGKIAVIAFHSIEDRIVKNFFKKESKNCICGAEVPVCVCKHKKSLEIITKKPIVPTDGEVSDNPRSRSAKLRVAKKI